MEVPADLERMSAAAVIAMSQRDWTFSQTPEAQDLLAHVAPDWIAMFDNYPNPLRFSEQVAAHQKFMDENPTAYYIVQSISTVFSASGNEASVFLEIDIKNLNGITIAGQSEFRWRREGKKWLWYYHLGMRGTSDF